MSKYDLPQVNATGVDNLLLDIVNTVPIFVPFLLLFIYVVVFLVGYRSQKNDSGFGDAPLWSTVAGVATSIVALILSTKGMIELSILIIPILMTILSAIWLFASNDRY